MYRLVTSITSKCSSNSHVGTGSDEQDFDADFCIILQISSGDARVNYVIGGFLHMNLLSQEHMHQNVDEW